MTYIFDTSAPPGRHVSTGALEATFAAIYQDGQKLGLTDLFVSKIQNMGLKIQQQKLLNLTRNDASGFILSADPMATWDAAKKIHKRYQTQGRLEELEAHFGTQEIDKIKYQLYVRTMEYLAGPLISFEIHGTDAIERVRSLVDAPKGSTEWCVRKDFYPDDFDTANKEGRAFGKRMHAAKNIEEAHGGVLWFRAQCKEKKPARKRRHLVAA